MARRSKELDLSYDLFSTDAVTLDELQSRTIALRSRKHDKGLKVHFAEFPNLDYLSTLNKGPFIAFEPDRSWACLHPLKKEIV